LRYVLYFFFFQAEDGIRDVAVTGVQTCALPIYNPAPDRFSVNGNLELQNNFLLNGVDNNSWSENLQEFSVQVVQPPPDAVQEFRVQTRSYDTEFGNSAGAVINVAIKSGTNAYHGNLFEYLRNAKLDANSWINNRNNQP